MKSIREKCEGRIEFDILVDGKYRNRVAEGILIESKPFGAAMYMRGSKKTVFDALIVLHEELERQGWSEEFELYKECMNQDLSSDIDDAIKSLDDLCKKLDEYMGKNE